MPNCKLFFNNMATLPACVFSLQATPHIISLRRMHHLIRTKQKHTKKGCLSKDVVQLDRDIGFLSAPCPEGRGWNTIVQILCILMEVRKNRDWSCEDLILSYFMIFYACPNPNISWYFPHSAGSSWTQLDLMAFFQPLRMYKSLLWFCNKWRLLHQDQPAPTPDLNCLGANAKEALVASQIRWRQN